MNIKKIYFFVEILFPWFLWMLLIFSFSSHPTGVASTFDWQDFIIKKSAHVFVYFMLTFFTFRAMYNLGISKKRSIAIAFCFSLIYAISDEFHQSFTPGREPTVRDILFDTIGSLIAIIGLWKLPRIHHTKLRKLAYHLRLD